MKQDSTRVEVKLSERSYFIHLGYHILRECVAGLKEYELEREVFLISDSTVYPLYGVVLEDLLAREGYRPVRFVLPAGEESKSWAQAENILAKMLEKNLGRKTAVLALGGGVTGDLAGFVASLYRRGLPLFQIPTTLLAQVDSSVGGKTAVNHPLGKNMIGTFYQPQAVWADLSTLETLPPAEWRAGLAEVLKYAVIRDYDFFTYLEKHALAILERHPGVVLEMVAHCCRVKAAIIGQDERDEGLRNILNFGHTFGHALESATGFKGYRHGEAVAVGMAGALELAVLLELMKREDAARVISLLREWGLPIIFAANLLDEVLNRISYDKKAAAKEPVFILPVAIGEVILKKGIPRDTVRKALMKITL